MAGADNSGEGVDSGRVNRAEDTTTFWAQREEDGDFGGRVILTAEAALNIDDDDYKTPKTTLHGILGVSHLGGVGVIGLDKSGGQAAFNQGVQVESPLNLGMVDLAQIGGIGVFGKGETGIVGKGVKDAGVRGVGGIRDGGGNLIAVPQPGVIGTGGTESANVMASVSWA